MLDIKRLHQPIEEALEEAVLRVVRSGGYIGGREVTDFEQMLAEYLNVGHAVAVSSGTDALLVSLMALGLNPGDEVITTPYTFFATAGSVSRLGATPVFVDIDPGSYNIDPALVQAAVTDRTVGIIPVHLFGGMAPMGPIVDVAKRNRLWILEDAAQAIGADDGNLGAGATGRAGVFSFFPAKNLGAMGDAGAVVTGDEQLASRMSVLRNHGAAKKYSHDLVGGNFRMDALQAAVLAVKLPHLARWEEGRRSVAGRYDRAFEGLSGVALPVVPRGGRHVFNQYVIRTPMRDALKEALDAAKIGNAIYYPSPLHLQGCFGHLGYGAGSLPQAEGACGETLALPIDPMLTVDEQQSVVDVVIEFFDGNGAGRTVL